MKYIRYEPRTNYIGTGVPCLDSNEVTVTVILHTVVLLIVTKSLKSEPVVPVSVYYLRAITLTPS